MASEDCCKGTIHDGKPVGRVETIHNIPCYVSEPLDGAEPKGVIVILSDAFGWQLNNTRLLADTYAKRCGMRVLLPDFMEGDPLDSSLLPTMETFSDPTKSFFSRLVPGVKALSAFVPWVRRQSPENVIPRINAFLSPLRDSTYPTLPLGAAGFCWGGKFVFMLAAESAVTSKATTSNKTPQGRPLIDAGFTAHPSNLKLPAEADAIVKPLSVTIGSLDIVAGPKEAELMKTAWKKKGLMNEGEQSTCELHILEGAKHGFGLRGNQEIPEEKKLYEATTDQAVNFFNRVLVAGSS